jgi:hypothetical protein
MMHLERRRAWLFQDVGDVSWFFTELCVSATFCVSFHACSSLLSPFPTHLVYPGPLNVKPGGLHVMVRPNHMAHYVVPSAEDQFEKGTKLADSVQN